MLRASLLLAMLLPTTAIAAGSRGSGPKVMVMRGGKLLPLSGKVRRPRENRALMPRTIRRNAPVRNREARTRRTVLSPRMRLAISRWPNNARGRFLRQRQLSTAKREMQAAVAQGTPLEQASTRALYQSLLSEAR